MKKLGLFAMVLSAGLFFVGCEPKKAEPAKKPADTTTPADKDKPADTGAAPSDKPADAPAGTDTPK